MINLGKGNEEENNNSVDVEFQNAPSPEEMQNMNNMNHQMTSSQGFDMNQGQGMDMNQGYQNSMDMNSQNNGMQGQNQYNNQNQGQQNNQMGGYNQGQQGYNQGQQMNQGYGQQNNQGYGQQNNQMGYNQNQGQQNNQMGGYNQGQQNNQGYGQQNNQGYGQQQGHDQQMQQQPQQSYGQQNSQGYADASQSGMNQYGQSTGGALASAGGEMSMEQVTSEVTEYKQRLRGMREVQALTSEVDIHNTNSIINFGQKASDNISKISDELLNSMKAVKAEEASEMLVGLTKIMDKFDVKELEKGKSESKFAKLFNKLGDSVAKLFQKYDSMGFEVQKVYVLLKKYENDIKEANGHLKRLYDGNLEYYRILEKYIVAGEMAVEEIDMYLEQIPNDTSLNPEEKQMMLQKLEISKDMLSQRVYDLQIAENVAIQAAPMIQTIQMSNFNLMRKINSSFIVTLPIFKQCLAQAIILKRQDIQAKSIKQLDDKTNELILRNASNTARQSVEIAKMSSGSSVQIETLQKSFETIMKGIEDTKAIQAANRQQRTENSHQLESIKANMKKHIAES